MRVYNYDVVQCEMRTSTDETNGADYRNRYVGPNTWDTEKLNCDFSSARSILNRSVRVRSYFVALCLCYKIRKIKSSTTESDYWGSGWKNTFVEVLPGFDYQLFWILVVCFICDRNLMSIRFLYESWLVQTSVYTYKMAILARAILGRHFVLKFLFLFENCFINSSDHVIH